MALAATYKQFLAAPDASLLANDASLHYITTTTTFTGAADIIKVIKGTNGQLKKNKENVLHVVQGQNALAAEVDTALEFFTSGGPYLPGLDDNFLADRKVYLNVTHFVSFDGQGKISQIRQTWDQGSLLKQLDVIGKTGRNWPIRDSKEQIRMIETCVKSGPVAAPQEPTDVPVRPRTNTANTANVSRDPHTSLNLFAPREDSDHSIATVISPKAGARPRQRDFAEIFGDEPVEDPDSPSAGRRAASPSKAIAPKAGAGKNYQPSRLFDTEAEDDKSSPDETRSPVRGYKPHPTKYNHFDFADGSDPSDAPRPGDPTFKRTKHSSQWGFEDFATPAKPKTTKNVRQQDARHWGNGDNEVFDSPQQRKPVQGKARRDAEAHFELIDDGLPTGEPRASRPRGSTHNTGLGLYQNNLYNDEGEEGAAFPAEEGGSRALGVITNQKGHDRNFQPHWNMEDQSPAPDPQAKPAPAVGEDRKKAVKMMDANWSSYDVSPSQKENHRALPGQNGSFKENNHDAPKERGIRIGGDGMGGSRGSNRSWFFGEDTEEGGDPKTKPAPGRKGPATAGMKSGGFDWNF